jgi:hypothetical protein
MIRVNLAAPQKRRDGPPYFACLSPHPYDHEIYLSLLLPRNSFVMILVKRSDTAYYNLRKVTDVVENKDN